MDIYDVLNIHIYQKEYYNKNILNKPLKVFFDNKNYSKSNI